MHPKYKKHSHSNETLPASYALLILAKYIESRQALVN